MGANGLKDLNLLVLGRKITVKNVDYVGFKLDLNPAPPDLLLSERSSHYKTSYFT